MTDNHQILLMSSLHCSMLSMHKNKVNHDHQQAIMALGKLLLRQAESNQIN